MADCRRYPTRIVFYQISGNTRFLEKNATHPIAAKKERGRRADLLR
jgi:hypothetical protein